MGRVFVEVKLFSVIPSLVIERKLANNWLSTLIKFAQLD
jgi:hypothetical protein